MKKILLAGIMLMALVASSVAAEMTADDLVAKYLKATGGEQNFRTVKSVMMKGSMFAQGQNVDLKIFTILPNKSLTQISMNNMVLQSIGVNGTDAWAMGMGGTFVLSGDQKKAAISQSEMFPLLDYKKKGAKVKFLGEDLVKGAKVLKLEYASKDNDTTIYFLDGTTFLPVREKRGETVVSMSDHRKVGGLTFPFKISIQSANGQMMTTLDTIAINPSVPDSLFVMPKDAKPMPDMSKPAAAPDSTKGGGQK